MLVSTISYSVVDICWFDTSTDQSVVRKDTIIRGADAYVCFLWLLPGSPTSARISWRPNSVYLALLTHIPPGKYRMLL
jgi:hypothetical protein